MKNIIITGATYRSKKYKKLLIYNKKTSSSQGTTLNLLNADVKIT